MYTDPRVSAIATLAGLISHLAFPHLADFNSAQTEDLLSPVEDLATIQGQALIQTANPDTSVVRYSNWVMVTAYSSTPDQTDSTPFITASGTNVRDGVVACNFLRFGTKVRFPDLYGDKIFVVEDRMAFRNSYKIDIWFEDRDQAKEFGVKILKVEVFET